MTLRVSFLLEIKLLVSVSCNRLLLLGSWNSATYEFHKKIKQKNSKSCMDIATVWVVTEGGSYASQEDGYLNISIPSIARPQFRLYRP